MFPPSQLRDVTNLTVNPGYSAAPLLEEAFSRECPELGLIDDHNIFFLDALKEAKISIFVTSSNINYMNDSILSVLKEKVSAGVKIWLLSEKIDSTIKESLNAIKVYPILLPVHAKIVGIDNAFLAMGSYNWLDKQDDESIKPSVFIKDSISVPAILGSIWSYKGVLARFQDDPLRLERYFTNDPPVFTISEDPFHIELLIAPHQHHEFLKSCFQQAQHKITIHIDRVSEDSQFLNSIIKDLQIPLFFKRKGDLEIVYEAENRNLEVLRTAFSQHPSIKWLPVENLHSNSIIVDNGKIVTIGSYDWFASARRFGDAASVLLDTTLIFKDEAGLAESLTKY